MTMTDDQRSAFRALQESMDLRDNGGDATEADDLAAEAQAS
jgi:hypothetical protein